MKWLLIMKFDGAPKHLFLEADHAEQVRQVAWKEFSASESKHLSFSVVPLPDEIKFSPVEEWE